MCQQILDLCSYFSSHVVRCPAFQVPCCHSQYLLPPTEPAISARVQLRQCRESLLCLIWLQLLLRTCNHYKLADTANLRRNRRSPFACTYADTTAASLPQMVLTR